MHGKYDERLNDGTIGFWDGPVDEIDPLIGPWYETEHWRYFDDARGRIAILKAEEWEILTMMAADALA